MATAECADTPPVETARDELQEAIPKAAETLRELLDAEDERMQIRAAETILDRAGLTKAKMWSTKDAQVQVGGGKRQGRGINRTDPLEDPDDNDYAATPTVEECRTLDAADLKELTEHVDVKGAIWWGDREDPDAWMTVYTKGERAISDETRTARFRLKYTITDGYTDESEDVKYSIPIEYTECNFGGIRPWFRCPGVVDGERCGRRARKLYLPPARGQHYYLCRECYDLGYTSSRTSGDELTQAELRYRRTFAKADAENRRPHPNNDPWFPERPKGMHHDTYDELLADVREARWEWDDEFNLAMQQHLERMQGTLDRAPDARTRP